MPYKSVIHHRESARKSMKRSRIYLSALAANLPKALEAEQSKDPMRAFNILRAEKDKLSDMERQRLARPEAASERLSRANMMAVHDQCKASKKDCRKRYLELREQAIAEFEMFA